MDKLKWIEIKSLVKTFNLKDEPELIHIIKTGYRDEYMIVYEDAHNLNTGKVEFANKKQIKDKYGIDLIFNQ